MKTVCDAGELVRQRSAGISAAFAAFLAPIPAISRIPPTPLLRIEQLASDRVYIGERCSDLEPVQVLRHATVAGLSLTHI